MPYQAKHSRDKNLVALHGDRPIDTYTRSDVNELRDAPSERGLKPSSVSRVFNTLLALVNIASREQSLPDVRSFSGVYLGEDAIGSEAKCKPIPINIIKSIQAECIQTNDEARWLRRNHYTGKKGASPLLNVTQQ